MQAILARVRAIIYSPTSCPRQLARHSFSDQILIAPQQPDATYVAGWVENGELDSIRTYAQTIDRLARRIEDALQLSNPSIRSRFAR